MPIACQYTGMLTGTCFGAVAVAAEEAATRREKSLSTAAAAAGPRTFAEPAVPACCGRTQDALTAPAVGAGTAGEQVVATTKANAVRDHQPAGRTRHATTPRLRTDTRDHEQ
ncbi:hypothetical protein [Streptomyces sp. NPDC051997]|uniref:hypothetical protein n=1 Tax=Streptomyces sp. NPDC051997 TaxID=3155611 RepID=UPI003427B833